MASPDRGEVWLLRSLFSTAAGLQPEASIGKTPGLVASTLIESHRISESPACLRNNHGIRIVPKHAHQVDGGAAQMWSPIGKEVENLGKNRFARDHAAGAGSARRERPIMKPVTRT